MHHPAADRDRVEEALVPLDELLGGDRGATVDTLLDDRALELTVVVHPPGAGGAGGAARLEDDRVAHLGHEVAQLRRGGDAGRLGAGDVGAPQDLLHRRLVAAEEGGLDGGAGDARGLADLGGGEDVRLDRRLDPVHPLARLHAPDRFEEGGLVDHRRDLLVGDHPAAQLVVEVVVGRLADAGDARADRREPAHELALVVGKLRLDEDDVHGASPQGPRCLDSKRCDS